MPLKLSKAPLPTVLDNTYKKLNRFLFPNKMARRAGYLRINRPFLC